MRYTIVQPSLRTGLSVPFTTVKRWAIHQSSGRTQAEQRQDAPSSFPPEKGLYKNEEKVSKDIGEKMRRRQTWLKPIPD